MLSGRRKFKMKKVLRGDDDQQNLFQEEIHYYTSEHIRIFTFADLWKWTFMWKWTCPFSHFLCPLSHFCESGPVKVDITRFNKVVKILRNSRLGGQHRSKKELKSESETKNSSFMNNVKRRKMSWSAYSERNIKRASKILV